jgi:hypothetical protein
MRYALYLQKRKRLNKHLFNNKLIIKRENHGKINFVTTCSGLAM